jgi:hypothetical protein
MKCAKCQTDNPQENKFCRKCGKELLVKKAGGMFKEMGMDFWSASTQEILKRL